MPTSAPKRVLFLSIDGMTDSLGQSQVLPYLTGLREHGWDITLISAEKSERWQTHGARIEKLCSKTGIAWKPFHYRTWPPVIGGFINVWKMGRLARQMHRSNPFQLIHCRSYLPAMVGSAMKRKFNTPFIFDIRGFWVDEKLDGGIWRRSNPIHRILIAFFKKKEKSMFIHSDMIISLTKKALPAIMNLSGRRIGPEKIEVIPCCVDTTHFDPSKDREQEKSSWRNRLGLDEESKLMVYLGSLSTWYLPKQMLGFYKTMRSRIPDLKFLIITNENSGQFNKTLVEIGLTDKEVIFTSSGRDELPSLLSLAQYAVCFYNTSFSRLATSPTKLAELMSMGIPVVCSKNVGDVDDILELTKAGTVCDAEDPGTWAEAADELFRISMEQPASSIRTWAINLFDLQSGVSKYNQVYEKLVSHS